MSESDINRVWPEWQVEGVLGSGAFGTVYLIRRTVDDNTVFAAAKVIKVPPADEAVENAEKLGISRDLLSTYFGKFKNDLNWELTMFRTVSSQHLAVIDDLEVEDASGGPGWFGYIRTGLYTPLSVYFEKSPSTQEDAARLGSELCQALDACGEYSMVHGEIKPENVMVTDAGGFVLTDFGVRRCLEKAGTGIFGAMESDYEAPELGEDRKYTPAADIYSLGMVMCYTANGGTLPENRSPDMIKDIDKGLAAVIKKATAADPAERYQSAAEMRAAIARLPLGKKSPRRAMAAAAAFDAVKRNGGAIRPATAAAAVAAAGKNGRTDVSDVQNAAASKTAAAAEDMKKAAERSGFDRKKWESTGTPEKAEEKPKKGKKAFIIAGIAAVLVIIAVILALAKPWDNDDAPEGGVPNNEDTQPVDGEEDKTGDQDGENGEFNKPDDTQNAADDPDKDGDTPDAAEPGNDGGEDGPGTENGQTQGGDDDSQPGQEGGNPQSPGNSQTSQGGTSGGSGSGSNGSSGTNESSTGNSGSSAPKNNDVLFPSDSTLITESDLEGKTSYETYMLINEIYARHGKIFKTASIQKYFESQVWYTPVTSDSSAITPLFNDIETANVKTITAYQKAQGFRDGGTSSDTETQPGDSENNDDPAPAEPDTPEEPAKPVNNDVLFPSDTTLITAEDMEGMTRYETYMLINEIYARHGKIFKTESVQEYFESQIWYTPVSTSYSQAENQFNDIEWTNIYTIIEYQESQGYRD